MNRSLCKRCGGEKLSGVYCAKCFLAGLRGEFEFKWMSKEYHEDDKNVA